MNIKEKREIATAAAQKILKKNLSKLYKLNSRRYMELQGAIRGELGEFLRGIFNFWMKRETCMLKRGKMVYFLGTRKATYAIRKKTTTGVTNRWLNYLCALGLLKKTKLTVGYTRRSAKIAVRRTKKRNRNSRVPMYLRDMIRDLNTFEVQEYTPELLDLSNERAKLLKMKNITSGNISYNMLALNGLGDIAEEVYLERRYLSEEKKLRECRLLVKYMDSLIERNGYVTKAALYELMDSLHGINKNEVDRLFVLFQNELWLTRIYKPPTQNEVEKFGLKNREYIMVFKP